jgi:predicted TIM-barrel enzyme
MTETANNFIRGHNKKSVVICDRGLLDGKAYCTQENWNKILERVNVSF